MIKKVSLLKNKEKGKDIYILANAPSVKNHNLSLLKDKITIGMNANPLLEQEFGFISPYYIVSDLRFINHPEKKKMATEMLNPTTKRIFRYELKDYDENVKNETFYVKAIGKNGFSFDLKRGYFFGFTTTMLALQLAAYLGAKNIYLLGMDLKYSKKAARFYKEKNVQEFDPFTSFQIWNVRNAYLELEKIGIRLYNCSKNSLLYPYLPYIDYNDTF